MLEVSEAAAEAISMAAATQGNEVGGLRITVETTTEQGAELGAFFVDHAAEDDETITLNNGSHVFLEPEAGPYLTDKVLDLDKDAEGQHILTLHGRI